MSFIKKLRANAQKELKRIVLPESFDVRVLKAAAILQQQRLVKPVLLGDKNSILKDAEKESVNLAEVEIIDHTKSPDLPKFIDEYVELRKHKGMTKEQAIDTLNNPLFFSAFMVRHRLVAGSVAGSVATTGDVMKAAIQVVGLAENIKAVSSSFVMVLPNGKELTFGDCAVIPNPTAEQLASIAISSAATHQKLVGETPKIAMLSFSTKGSAQHEDVDKVLEATAMVKKLAPELIIDGEFQFDAAYVDSIGKKKAPDSDVAGKANVFIFPDLDSGNIGYKIAQRLANAQAIGPTVQGLAKPFNDLSRGCSVEDIVNVACICSILE
jgi:phosphate acetyltransferase